MKRKILKVLLAIVALMILFMLIGQNARTEGNNDYDGTKLYVTASQLNGRYAPRKTGIIEAIFDKDTEVTATGRWSKDMRWIEVYGGECETVWCWAEYLNEIREPVIFENVMDGRVKIRNIPGTKGRVTGYVKAGHTVTVTQIVLGYGKTVKGWIDLGYFSETGD